jgi:hypothetical protein
MMLDEFISLTKVPVTAAEYAEIEKQYIDCPDTWDKAKFCSEWMKNGGVETILYGRQKKIAELTRQLEEKNQDLEAMENDLKMAHAETDEALEAAKDWQKRYYEEKNARMALINSLHGLIA